MSWGSIVNYHLVQPGLFGSIKQMQILKLDSNSRIASIRAAGVLRSGGVILYPTDTLYGLGADAFSDAAVDKIYEIKARDTNKPMHAVCADLAMVEQYAEVNDIARMLVQKFLPGALTLVLQKKAGIDHGIGRNMKTIGIRIPDSLFCLEIARTFGKPFTATSANLADHSTGLAVDEILGQLGRNAGLIDLVVDAGVLPLRAPSTVVDVSTGVMQILRIGAISKSELDSLS